MVTKRLILLCVALFLSGCSSGPDVDTAGGVYAVSPDGQWLASIWDGHNRENDKQYAVVYLWDLKRYPSLKEDIHTIHGKHPEIKLVFPQDFQARDGKSKVVWNDASTEFKIVYEISSNDEKKYNIRTLVYDMVSDQFMVFQPSRVPMDPAFEAEQ